MPGQDCYFIRDIERSLLMLVPSATVVTTCQCGIHLSNDELVGAR